MRTRRVPELVAIPLIIFAFAATSAFAESEGSGAPPEVIETKQSPAAGEAPVDPPEPDDSSNDESDDMRGYVWIGGMTGFDMRLGDSINELGLDGAGIVDVKPGVGFSARFGGRSPHVGFEFSIDAIPKFRAEANDFTAFEYTHVYTGMNLRFYPLRPDSGRIHPNFIVGGGYDYLILKAQGDRRSFAGGVVRGGAGIDFDLTKQIALSLDSTYVLPFGDIEKTDYLTFGWGLLFRF